MTILTVGKKEFEKKIGNRKTYKVSDIPSNNIFSSNTSGSLDEIFFRRHNEN